MAARHLVVDGCDVHLSGPVGAREVVLVHGGPGAPGSLAPVARGLEDRLRVVEPWQRRRGEREASVAGHIDDLFGVLAACCRAPRPVLLGHSWGAMLALAAAARHPERVGPMVLVGCGTFDPTARALFRRLLADRAATLGIDLEADTGDDPDERFRRQARQVERIFAVDPVEGGSAEQPPFDARGSREAWSDMLRLQQEGTYPAAFRRITSAVWMLHGREDPHPGPAVRDGLRPFVPRLEYTELAHCGHSPWLERSAHAPFFQLLRSRLAGTEDSRPKRGDHADW